MALDIGPSKQYSFCLTSFVCLLGLRWDGLLEVSTTQAAENDGICAGPGCSATYLHRGHCGGLHASLRILLLGPQMKQKMYLNHSR